MMTTALITRSIPDCPQRRSDIALYELDDEALLHDPRTGDTHRLNASALFVWRECDGRRSPAAIARRMSETYQVSPVEACNHTDLFLKELADRRLIEEMRPNRSLRATTHEIA